MRKSDMKQKIRDLEKKLSDCRATKPKSFCSECDFYERYVYETGGVSIRCNHPVNREDTWYQHGGEYKKPPYQINENNDCGWFKPKPKRGKK